MSIIADQSELITREGYDRLRAEHEELLTVKRHEVAGWVRDARQDGRVPGENAGLTTALDEHAALERRIDELEAMLARARIAEVPADGVAGVGQRVRLRMDGRRTAVEYRLVGLAESDIARGRISIESPVGRALVGHRAGDVVEADTPGGARTIELLAFGDQDA